MNREEILNEWYRARRVQMTRRLVFLFAAIFVATVGIVFELIGATQRLEWAIITGLALVSVGVLGQVWSVRR